MRVFLPVLLVFALAFPAAAQTGGELVVQKGHRGWVSAIAWAPDGTVVATGGGDGTTRIWDAASGRLQCELPRPWGRVTGLAFTPDSRRVVVGQVNAIARVFDRRTGTWEHVVEFDRGGYCGVAVSPDGSRFACGGDRVVGVFDLESGREVRRIDGPNKDRFWAVAFNADGTELAAASDERTVYRWRIEDGRLRRTFRGHDGQARQMVWPNGGRLVSLDSKGTVRTWGDDDPQAELTGRDGEYGVLAAAGDAIASVVGSGAVVTRGGNESAIIGGRKPTALAFDPSTKRIAIGGDDGEVWIHELPSGRRVARLAGRTALPRAVAGCAGGDVRVLLFGDDGYLFALDLVAGKRAWRSPEKLDKRFTATISPDGTHVAYGVQGERVSVVRVSDGESIPFSAHAKAAGSLALSRGAGRLACRRSATSIAVFERDRDGAVALLPGDRSRNVLGLAFGVDRDTVMFGGKGNLVRVMSVASKKTVIERGGSGFHKPSDEMPPYDRELGWVSSLAASLDGEHLLCGGPYSALVLRKRDTLESVLAMSGHYGSVASCAFSDDGRHLFSVGGEGDLRVWNRADGTRVATIRFLPEGAWVVQTPDRRWDASPGAAAHAAWRSGGALKSLDSAADRRVRGLLRQRLAK